jgi:hypothetical protein
MTEPNREEEEKRAALEAQARYLKGIARQLVHELQPVVDLKEMTGNSDLLGAYAEAAVRNLVHRIVAPMRVSTGAVIDYPEPEKLRQIDIIIWMPHPAPAIYEIESFGMVPRSSAFGVLEVKRSNYSGIEDRLDAFMQEARTRKIVSDPGPGLIADHQRVPALSVITVLEKNASERLVRMVDGESTVAIIDSRGDKPIVRERDVYVLVNFLSFIVWRFMALRALRTYIQVPLSLFDSV